MIYLLSLQKGLRISIFLLLMLVSATAKNQKMNVLLIICDDLNDYIEGFGGHPQAQTPNIKRLMESGISFLDAHCNIPICNPSRASMMTGLYPHTSRCFGFEPWDKIEILSSSRTMMDHFRLNGYHVLGTGKVMHNRDSQEWMDYGHLVDYGPFANDGGEKDIAHPDVPAPFSEDFGSVDGSFGPLKNLKGLKSQSNGNPLIWRTGNWKKKRQLRYVSDEDRDLTGDELNAQWAVRQLKVLANENKDQPFFMGVGFVRPHTPLIVPKKYFDQFPLDSIILPKIKIQDAKDTFKHTLNEEQPDDRGGDRGSKMHDSLVSSFKGDRELALRKFIQAYLASIASVDDLVGEILDVVDNSSLKNDTVILFTSDHGWGMGEKNYLYKNSLWNESTRIPMIIRAPGYSKESTTSRVPVSLIDIYPTLLDICKLPRKTTKNQKGRPLDGYSLVPLIKEPKKAEWDGPNFVLTAMYNWSIEYLPNKQSYSLKNSEWRYIRYSNGEEELYDLIKDPKEWNNLASFPAQKKLIKNFRKELLSRISSKSFDEDQSAIKKDADFWKAKFFEKYPEADSNKDGQLSWQEHKKYKAKLESAKK